MSPLLLSRACIYTISFAACVVAFQQSRYILQSTIGRHGLGGHRFMGRLQSRRTAKPTIDMSISTISTDSTLPIFCNRELNLNQISAVGFDMDYTLAQYNTDFELLAYEGAKKKLVEWLGYPSKVLSFEYQDSIPRRGCMVDRKRGNILKLDQHRYVRAVEHGLTALSREQRKSVYRASYQETETFTGKEFSNVDTPFSLVDACLFAQLVDLKDHAAKASRGAFSGSNTKASCDDTERTYEFGQATTRSHQKSAMLNSKSYSDMWADLRRCIDRCHRDGAIKLTVAQDPAKYIVYDEKLFPTLKQLRQAGRKVFLLTNSLFDYTRVVMNYLQGRKAAAHERDDAWLEYFDLVIVGGNKPAFLLDESELSLYKVDTATGALSNCANVPTDPLEAPAFLQTHGKVFQGGNAHILHTLLQVPTGDNLLYVGDHIFADVLRSKRSLGWRTCLIVPELEKEVQVYHALSAQREELSSLKRRQFEIETTIDALYVEQQRLLADVEEGGQSKNREDLAGVDDGPPSVEARRAALEGELRGAEEVLRLLRAEIRGKFAEYDAAFHPRWGQLFKAGFQESRIAKQLRDYACTYTSRVSNLGAVSPCRPLRPVRDRMPHDHLVQDF